MKFLSVVVILLAVVAATLARSSSWGSTRYGDQKIAEVSVVRPPGTSYTVKLNFPGLGQRNTKIITAIYVYDHVAYDQGAQAFLTGGGPGYRYANITLTGNRNTGINSAVQYWVRP